MSDTDPDLGVRMYVGLVSAMPMSEAQRARQAQIDERERRRVELEEQSRVERDLERRFDRERHGQELHTVGEFLQGVVAQTAREDRRQAAAAARMHSSECGCASCGRAKFDRLHAGVVADPRPRPKPVTAGGIHEQAAALKEEPASKWDVLKLFGKLKPKVDQNARDLNVVQGVVAGMITDPDDPAWRP